MGLLLEATKAGQHGKDRLDDHAFAPGFAGTDFQIRRIAGLRMKALVAKEDHLFFVTANHRVKDRIVHIGGVAIPIDN